MDLGPRLQPVKLGRTKLFYAPESRDSCHVPVLQSHPNGSIEILLAEKLNRVAYRYCARSWQTRNTRHLWTSLAFRECISPITFSVFMQSFLTRTSLPSQKIPHGPYRWRGGAEINEAVPHHVTKKWRKFWTYSTSIPCPLLDYITQVHIGLSSQTFCCRYHQIWFHGKRVLLTYWEISVQSPVFLGPRSRPKFRVSLKNKILKLRLLLCTKVKPWPR